MGTVFGAHGSCDTAEHVRPRPWTVLAASAAVLGCLGLGVPAASASSSSPRSGAPALEIFAPHFTTLVEPPDVKKGEHYRSLIRVTFRVEQYDPVPGNFRFAAILWYWGKTGVKGRFRQHIYHGCGANWKGPCVHYWYHKNLPGIGGVTTWTLDAQCHTNRYYIETQLFNYHIGSQSPVVEFFPTKAPHEDPPDRADSWLVKKCPKPHKDY